MRAVVFTGNGSLEVQTLKRPKPEAGEVLLKVHNCGVCGSDLHMVQYGLLPPGSVMGHEFSGEVVEVGQGVTGWNVGDRAVSLPVMACGKCESCQSGLSMCQNYIGLGLGKMPGGFSEFMRVDPRCMFKIPDHVSYREAALTEPLAVGLHAVNLAGLKEGQGCLIMGAGTVGLGVLLWALEKRAIVVVSELSEGRRKLASAIGQISVVDPSQDDPSKVLKSLTAKGAEVVVECVGIAGTLQKAMDVAAKNGVVVVMGVCMAPDTITPLTGIVKELDVKFGFGYTPQEFKETFDAIISGRIDVKPLITDIVGVEEFPAVFKELMKPNNKGKVLLEFN